MLDTWRRSGLRGLLPLVGPRAGWWTRISRRDRLANVGSIAGFCSVFLAMLAAWLLGAVSSGAGPGMVLLLALAVPCLAVVTWLYLAARQPPAAPPVDGATSAEMERQALLRAVNNMPIGLVMFDANKRALIVNDCYREMYELSQAVTARGSHLREMLEERLASGSQEGADRETYIERILKLVEQTESSTRLVPLGDGRTVNIIHHPIPGGGWIGTHEDVTEREKLYSQLERQNELLRQRELQLQTQNLQFDAALKNMSQGLCMFDREQRLLVCNNQYAELYRLPPELTRPGTSLQRVLQHRVGVGLCDGEHVRDRLAMAAGNVPKAGIDELSDGRAIMIKHQPMPDGGFVATLEDVTEREKLHSQLASQNELLRQRELQLKAQNLLFDAALTNMSQGLIMFDREQRLLVCNNQFAELYGMPAELTRPGTSLQSFLDYRVRAGLYKREQASSRMDAATSNVPSSSILELGDGRAVLIKHQPMPGGGFVATHEDITEREKLHLQLARQNELLRERELQLKVQNLQFDAALKNMSQGLCMFNREQRLLVCNSQYAELYGLPPELTRPGTTLQTIVAHRAVAGLLSDENYVRDVFAITADNVPVTRITELRDGRAIMIKHQPMPDGGFVATHEDITEQRNVEARIKHMAHHDALTDLPNRLLLREQLERALEEGAQRGPIAVLWLDLDRFKEVNDTLGHATGDALLKGVGERLQSCVRAEDTVARLGGDEFAIIQTGTGQPVGATVLAARLIEAIGAPFQINDHQIVVGASVGISIAPEDTESADELLKNADLALYRAKSDGRSTYRFFEPAMDALMHARRQLEIDLRDAIGTGAFELFYQPILDVETGRIVGVESLLRWNHPGRGRIEPAEFIPLAEETGLIVAIGEWVLRTACAQAVTLPRPVNVAVNLSALQFSQGDLVRLVLETLAATGLDANRLELEVTESLLLENTDKVLTTLGRLRDAGVRIAMDDFGTAYSSLSSLRSFPFDKIKIDKSFVHGLGGSDHAFAIIEAVAGIGARLDMVTTAEGVETEDQLAWVRALGVTEVQGFHTGVPLAYSEVVRLLAEEKGQAAA
jgi:diguanylate cyclase (GGDEF)-like protein